MTYIYLSQIMCLPFPPLCNYKFINNRATEMQAGQGGWTRPCIRPHAQGAGGCYACSGAGVWFYLGARLGSFKTTMLLSRPQNVVWEPNGPWCCQEAGCWEWANPAKTFLLGLSAFVILPTQPLDVQVSLTPCISARPRDSSPIMTCFLLREV